MTGDEILTRIALVCSRGGSVSIEGDGDRCTATVLLATPWRSGPERLSAADATAAGALAAVLSRVHASPPKRPSGRLEGRWYITDRAAREYAQLMLPRSIDAEQATDELIGLSEQAHLVRLQDNGLELWRVRASNGFRIRLLIGEPEGVQRGKPALVQVLGEHGGAQRAGGRR